MERRSARATERKVTDVRIHCGLCWGAIDAGTPATFVEQVLSASDFAVWRVWICDECLDEMNKGRSNGNSPED